MCTISISVVIPTFNRASQLRSTLIALLNSVAGHSSLGEVVVVDDGSTDETCSVVKQIGQGIRYLRTIDLGKQVQEIRECVWPTPRMYFFSTMTLLYQRITINVLSIPSVW